MKAQPLLSRYRKMRNFSRTAEPRGKVERSKGDSFVIQKHDATALHYDFRLELDGVLKSWAVPKGPSLSPDDKRLAMEVEDHPLGYRDFEGTIAEGGYGAGPVIVWDRGRWKPLEDPHQGLRKGALKFELDGEKLHGRFSLVRLPKRGKKPAWLLIKGRDAEAREGEEANITALRPDSVISGRGVEELATGASTPAGKRRAKKKAPARRTKSTTQKMPRNISPQLATLVDAPPAGVDYVYEIKFDGYRALAMLEGGRVRMITRGQQDWTDRFGPVASAIEALPARSAVLDGEVCYVQDDGRTDFQHLQNALKDGGRAAQARLAYFAFDLLFLDGKDLRELPLRERKAALRKLIGHKSKGSLRYSDDLTGDARVVLSQACQLGLEGVIGKRPERPHVGQRSADWIKLKCQQRQEFVIVGYTAPRGSREGFGALLLGVREGETLRYAGKVGTGFTDSSLRELEAKLSKLKVAEPALKAPRLRDATWIEPRLVCEVSFTEFTRDGSLRHPSFEGLREDKRAAQVHKEEPAHLTKADVVKAAPSKSKPGKDKSGVIVAGVRFSHPERVMDKASGTTKLDLARYHEAVYEWLMPYAERRPIALVRCPEGEAGACFFQKRAARGMSAAVKQATIAGNPIVYVTEPRGLFELVQFNAVEFHGWGARMPRADKPDWVVFDLDPDQGMPFSRVVAAAREVRERLSAQKLESFVKTTGGKGLHVVVPIAPRYGWDEVKGFAETFAKTLAQEKPKDYVATMSKAKRRGKIFIDWLRNGQGATAVLPYSPRAKPDCTVAWPLDWDQLDEVEPRQFTVASVPKLLGARKQDPWATFLRVSQALPSG